MALDDINDPTCVRKAMREFERLGEEAFFERYGFRQSTIYDVLDDEGRRYPPKAILGVAHKFVRRGWKPLTSHDFYGGDPTNSILESLGFMVVPKGDERDIAMAAANVALLDPDQIFPEGRRQTVLHIRRERNPKLRKAVFEDRWKSGFACEICDLSRPNLPDDVQRSLFEAHHIIPIAKAGASNTKVSDMALLCASCHRMIHKLIAMQKKWLSVVCARDYLEGRH